MQLQSEQVRSQRRVIHRHYVRLTATTRRSLQHGLYPEEPENCRRRLRAFLPNLANFAAFVAVSHVYRLETPAFRIVAILTLAALPVHYLAPFRWKKPISVMVAIVGMAWIFGVSQCLWLLLFSSVFVGICAVPCAWRVRVGILVAIGVGLAAIRSRTGLASTWAVGACIPVLASLFMFRIVLYMYELKHCRQSPRCIDALSYFLLTPNLCFLHFPVVDYQTFLRGYFASDVHQIQRGGLIMILRGTVHLLAYRLIHQRLLGSPSAVANLWDLACYLVCNYLLYLRVSGQFHIACGMLHLFGFQLPETHKNYLLATGFTDYWRRINIYWKDFMVRIVFNPIVYRLKREPQPLALAAGTIAVFSATWILHAYQSFWLRGTWGFSAPDGLFWGILGVLVFVNVQQDARRPRAGRRTYRLWGIGTRVAKVVATFTTIAVLWSLWSSPNVGDWVKLLRRGLRI